MNVAESGPRDRAPMQLANTGLSQLVCPRLDRSFPQGSTLTEDLGATAEKDHIFLVEDPITKTYHKNIDKWSYPIDNPAIQDPNVKEYL